MTQTFRASFVRLLGTRLRVARWLVAVLIAGLWFAGAFTSVARANSDTWKLGLNANWENGGAWTDGTTPGNSDTASLGFASTYTVTFGVAPAAIQNLTVNNGGTVTFASSGGAKTLNINSATGAQELDLGTGTTLILGTSGNVVNVLAGTNIVTQSTSDLEARFGSHLTAVDFGTGGLGGSLVVNGAGSLLTLTGSGEHLVGGSNGNGSITLQNSTASAAITGSLGVGDAASGGTGSVSLTGNSTVTLASDLKLASQGVAGTSGTLSIAGATTSLTQSGTGAVIVGSFISGQASINVAGSTSATLTTGTGGLGIRATGSVTVGGAGTVGTLNVNGDVSVSGGGVGTGLNVASTSTFTQVANKNFFVQGGGQAIFGGDFTTPNGSLFFIDGAGSKLQASGNNIGLAVNGGAQMSLTNGAAIAGTMLQVGTSGNGTLTVDGAGSTATATGVGSSFGLSHSTGTVTFSNGATGSFANGLSLAPSLFADTSASVMVKTGSHLNTGSLSIANSPGNQESPTATLTVTDANSTVAVSAGNTLQLSGPFIVGNATLTVQNNASLTVGTGGNTAMYPGAVLNINGGSADLKALNYNGGTINFTIGSLSYLGNLQVGIGGILGSDLTIGAGKVLTLSGTTTVDNFHTLAVSGGTLNTGSLVVNGGFSFAGGTLGITGVNGLTIGAGGPLGSVFALGAGRTLNVANTTYIQAGSLLEVDSGANLNTSGMTNQGELVFNGLTAVGNGNFYSNLGLIRGEGVINATVDNPLGGEIRAEQGKRLKFQGTNTPNLGLLNLQGGTAEYTKAYTNGATGQIVGRGTLKTGGMTNLGNIALAGGVTDVFGDVNNNTGSASKGIAISGNGAVNFWDDVTNTSGLFKVNSGSTATFFGTFSGNGITGNASDIHFESDISPGFSPASITLGGNVSFGAAARLVEELGGTTPGAQYDQLHVTGQLSLDGTLRVTLINGFTPAAGQTFNILQFSPGSLSGVFSSLQLPALAAPLGWDASQLYTLGSLSVTATLHGDWNRDGQVTIADIPAMLAALANLSNYESINALSDAQLAAIGDFDNSGTVSNKDIQGLLNLLASQGAGSVTAVPETSSWALAIVGFGLCCMSAARRRSARHFETT